MGIPCLQQPLANNQNSHRLEDGTSEKTTATMTRISIFRKRYWTSRTSFVDILRVEAGNLRFFSVVQTRDQPPNQRIDNPHTKGQPIIPPCDTRPFTGPTRTRCRQKERKRSRRKWRRRRIPHQSQKLYLSN